MMTRMLISAGIALAYIIATVFVQKRIPASMSALCYTFKGAWRWLWSLWIWTTMFLLAFDLIPAMPEKYQVFAFATCACLLFVGAMPLFNIEKNTAHNVFGIGAGVFSQVCVMIMAPQVLWGWIVLLPIGIDFLWRMIQLSRFTAPLMGRMPANPHRFYDECMVFILETIAMTNTYTALYFVSHSQLAFHIFAVE